MRKTRQTSEFIEKMGPFFVGYVLGSQPRRVSLGWRAKRKPVAARTRTGPPERPDRRRRRRDLERARGDVGLGRRSRTASARACGRSTSPTAPSRDARTTTKGFATGPAEWFHKNDCHDLRERSTYVAGKLHGKRVWQRTPKGKTPGFEWFDKLGENTWRYEVPHFNGTSQPRHATRYGKTGMESRCRRTRKGARSISASTWTSSSPRRRSCSSRSASSTARTTR